MLTRLLITLASVGAVASCSWWWQRRGRHRGSPAPTLDRARLPRQLHRPDFDDGSRPVLVVLFSSRTCGSCEGVRRTVRSLEASDVTVVEVAYQDAAELHRRYEVPGVPLVLVAGPDGVVEGGFLGPFDRSELEATLRGLRGREPEPAG